MKLLFDSLWCSLAQEMALIIEQAEVDAAQSGVRCRIQMRQLSYYDFLQAFDK